MEQLLHQHFATTRISDLINEPSNPPSNVQTTELISKSLIFVALYRLPQPFFKSSAHEAEWDHSARDAEAKLGSMRRAHEADEMGMVVEKREGLWRHIFASIDRRRPITVTLGLAPSSTRAQLYDSRLGVSPPVTLKLNDSPPLGSRKALHHSTRASIVSLPPPHRRRSFQPVSSCSLSLSLVLAQLKLAFSVISSPRPERPSSTTLSFVSATQAFASLAQVVLAAKDYFEVTGIR
ncbi:hypothetical protein BCR35DRAFT_332724 [Leucosporidium creatinivorum]|uniref:Uncharacterized protein n=1 Tax=Leucosporidium creatinivorum TaxID=106004 RepID=A0A1Y2F1S6_9BASI|nr:hypothetical protein BCR35DRAFT_332724 [Leucosporidium creatinivorum]